MPCIEKEDTSSLAASHIASQKAVLKNLRERMSELEAESKKIKASDLTEEASERIKRVDESIKHLRLELNGEVEDPARPGIFIKSPAKRTAEERLAVMEALYKERQGLVFYDTMKDKENPRKASLFGVPTVAEMVALGHEDIAREMMVRATSLVLSRADSKNPVDYLDTHGLEVKAALSNLVEWHHIYNNVHLDENGRVTPKSFDFYRDKKTGSIVMKVVPSYWNAQEHGKNTQFIALMDAMHAGEDPVAHLHYYRFNDKESDVIKAKIKSDIGEVIQDSKTRAAKLKSKLSELEQRRSNPNEYERDIKKQIAVAVDELNLRKEAAKGLLSKPKATLSEEQLKRRSAHDAQKRELSQLQKKLDEHQSFVSIRSDIEKDQSRVDELNRQIKQIKLNELPVAERAARRAEREKLEDERSELRDSLKDKQKLLKVKGDIDEQISDTREKLEEAKLLSDLTEEEAVKMFDNQNGFFSFDKGRAEKDAHTVYRPLMNEELTRYHAREAIEHLSSKHGENALTVLQEMGQREYQNNLLQRMDALMAKVRRDKII